MLVWWFFLLGCSAVGFTIKILLDHIKEADQINDQIFSTRTELAETDEKITAVESEINQLKIDLETLQKAVTPRKGTVETLQGQISKRKNDLARQGKFKVE